MTKRRELMLIVFFVLVVLALFDGINCQQYFDVGEDYLCTKWEPYTECTVSCGGGVHRKTRRCVWKEPDSEEDAGFTDTVTQPCNAFKCPEFSQWSTWSECPVTCGKGVVKRDRKCTSYGITNECNHHTTDTKSCVRIPCPTWGDWGKWGRCSVTCGEGLETRKRFCNSNVVRGPSCEGLNLDQRKCNAVFCPYWSDWSEWSSCEASCGPGERVKSRTCIKDPSMSTTCDGDARAVEPCTRKPCSQWTAWTDWEKCDVTCGNGQQLRHRKCTHLDGGEGKCNGTAKELKECDIPTCPYWDEWSSWSKCSAQCGGGVRDRTRGCIASDGLRCDGSPVEDEPCALYPCPQWDAWSSWSNCSVYCGEGVRIKTRKCQEDSPSNIPCQGLGAATKRCKQPDCSSWNRWSKWSECDATCDRGMKRRHRSCFERNGFDCDGEPTEAVVCAPYPCPRWKQWSDWAECNVTCDGGMTERSRDCGADPRSNFTCTGNRTQLKQCGETPCKECKVDLFNCEFDHDLCHYNVSSRSPTNFFFRKNPKGFAEVFAPYPTIGDWTELKSVAFKACMTGVYCISMDYKAGSVGSETSRAFVVIRSGSKEMKVWDRNSKEQNHGELATFDVHLTAGEQMIIKVHKDIKAFEYFWIHSIKAKKGPCL